MRKCNFDQYNGKGTKSTSWYNFLVAETVTIDAGRMSKTRCLIFYPPVPITTELHGGIYNDRMIYISGVPKPQNKRFTINLQESRDHLSDIGFRFDVRFQYGGIKGVVRNYRVHGGWFGEETEIPYFPFKENEHFYLIIHAKKDRYKVTVNNEPFIEYRYKASPEKFKFLNVSGDIVLSEINYQ